MKKLAFGLSAATFISVCYLIIPSSQKEVRDSERIDLPEVPIISLSGDTILFSKHKYSGKLILNFYGTRCDLCTYEINDIVSYSRKYSTSVLFITADSIKAIKEFHHQLTEEGISDYQITFAQISLQNAEILFGDLIVPQTILIDGGLKGFSRKKGVITYSYLKKSFESR